MKAFSILLMIAFGLSLASGVSILEKIRDDPDLSQFYDYLENDAIARTTINLRAVTLFVPTNQAFQKVNKTAVTYLSYHMTTVAYKIEQLEPVLTTDMEGNPPIYISRKKEGGHENIYVNNALILKSRSNFEGTTTDGKKQIMHVIDSVLVPLTTSPTATREIHNPDAYTFLQHADTMDIGGFRTRSYRHRVNLAQKEYVYQAVGSHTFFIPIEEGFKPSPRPELIDKKVIDGHVIPNQVIFTAAAPLEMPLITLAYEDNIKVSITFFSIKDGSHSKMFVKSNILVGDPKHFTGVVMAEIVKANIPVRNGVVHLIHRPLMIVDTTVQQFLNDKDDGPLRKFYDVVMDYGGRFMEEINKLSDVTILAPSNEAWEHETVKKYLGNRAKMQEILNLHIIRGRLNIEKIRQENQNSIAQIATNAPMKYLYFNIINNGLGNETATVEGGGVNATIIQPDIVQTNGYVHIIDKVLGIPSSTVLEKISTDPMMNATYVLGELSNFNKQLGDPKLHFTYFVPRDRAWYRTQTEHPSTHKKLFMKDFAYHAKSILERHLVVADRSFTIDDLRRHENDSIQLPSIRDLLTIQVREQRTRGGYEVNWNNRWIPIYRPDVECTNGIIHVLDEPFLQESDIRVTGGTSQTQLTLSIIIANILMISIAKLLL